MQDAKLYAPHPSTQNGIAHAATTLQHATLQDHTVLTQDRFEEQQQLIAKLSTSGKLKLAQRA
jgi:hypothetical protein